MRLEYKPLREDGNVAKKAASCGQLSGEFKQVFELLSNSKNG
jgi:hypothetical protein